MPQNAADMNRELEDIATISWDRLSAEISKDRQLSLLIDALATDLRSWKNNPDLDEYARYSESLYTSDGVVMYNDRVVVPHSLRNIISKSLHAAHQGVSSIERRAKSIVFWTGITNDI